MRTSVLLRPCPLLPCLPFVAEDSPRQRFTFWSAISLFAKVLSQVAAIMPYVLAVGPHIATIMTDVALVAIHITLVVTNIFRLLPGCGGISVAQILAAFSLVPRDVTTIATNISAVAAYIAAVVADVFAIMMNVADIVSYIPVRYGRRNLCHRHRAQSQRCSRDPEHHLPGSLHIVSHLPSGLSGVANMNPTLPEKVSLHYRGTRLPKYAPTW